ncbi:MAG: tetratricopeptide repeat protein, partial [Myxococcota bacterium]|nr:tetratricopeptide repeat protein [Myxococcota bacterium]
PAPPLPRGLRLTAPTFEELRDGRGHRLAEANVGSPAPTSRVDAFAVTQPEIRRPPMPDPLSTRPEESAPLGRPFLSYADDSDPSLVAVPAPSTDARSSVQSPGEEEFFQASASLSSEGRIVSAPPDTDATPVRTTPPRLPPRPVVVEDRVRPPSPRAPAPSWHEEPQPELGGRNLELSIPEDAPPLELAREVRGRGPGPGGVPFSDTRWTDSVLEEANALEREGDVAGAVQVLERAIATAPKPAALYNRLGLVMVKRSNLVQAAALLQKAIALEPSNSVFRRNAEKIARLSDGPGTGRRGR